MYLLGVGDLPLNDLYEHGATLPGLPRPLSLSRQYACLVDAGEDEDPRKAAANVNGVETHRLKPELSTDWGEFRADSVEKSGSAWG